MVSVMVSVAQVLLCLVTQQALAFFPGAGSDFWPNLGLDVMAPRTISHADQTETAIMDFLEEYFEDDFGFFKRVPNSVKNARQAIVHANEDVDSPTGQFNEKNYGPAHFDDEYFAEGQDHLMRLRSEMIAFLQTGDVEKARTWLGRQFHTLQDFYSHSNWIEMNGNVISDIIGNPSATAYSPARGDTCNDYCIEPSSIPIFGDGYLAMLDCYRDCFQGDQELSDLLAARVCVIPCAEPDDYCSLSTDCGPHTCSRNIINVDEVTTGYYFVETDPQSAKPEGKCSHGGMNDDGTVGVEGINKDSTLEYYAPRWFLHRDAARVSIQATKKYIQDLTQDWGDTFIGGTSYSQPKVTDRQLRQLFGLGSSTLAFVIDTTGSMGGVIASVRQTAIAIVNEVRDTDAEPASYVLMGYNDPVGSNLIATDDADAFILQLNSLFANGGDDCPEPSISALGIALDKIAKYGDVFLFTDAEPSDAGGTGSVSAYAREQQIRISVFQFASGCSASGAYESVTRETSGIYLQLSDSSVTSSVVGLAVDLIAPKAVRIYNDFPFPSDGTAPVRRAAVETEVVIDSTLESISISATGPASILITKPDGSVLGESDPGVTYLVLFGLTYVTIEAPAPGTWIIYRSDESSTGLSIFGSSFLSFNYLQFVFFGGSHPGWFPIETSSLVPGTEYTVKADVEGDFSNIAFQFRAQDSGQLIKTFDMEKLPEFEDDDLPPSHVWYGSVTMPPCGAFYAYITGNDATGAPFQRYYPSVFGTPSRDCTYPPDSPSNTTSTSSTVPGTSTTASVTSSYTSATITSPGHWNSTVASSSFTSSNHTAPGNHTNTATATASSNATTSIATVSTTIATCDGQCVDMTETVVVISTLTTCPVVTTVTPCPTDSGAASCAITTTTVSMVPDVTTTVFVPIDTEYPAFSSSSPLVLPGDEDGEPTGNVTVPTGTTSGPPVTAGTAKCGITFTLSLLTLLFI